MTASWRGPTLNLLLVAALYVAVRPWLIDAFGPRTLVAAVAAGVLLVSLSIAWWQSRTRHYVCPHCQHTFSVSLWRNLIGQDWFGRLHTTCPRCSTSDWCDAERD